MANIRTGWKDQPGTNALPYMVDLKIAKKFFITLTTRADVIKVYSCLENRLECFCLEEIFSLM
jgi:hypothetical protein